MKTTFLTGMIGFLLSLFVLLVSLVLPLLTRGVSWGEAAVGIVPGAACSFVFLAVMLVGLFLMLSAAQRASVDPRQRVQAGGPSAGAVFSWIAVVLLAVVGLGAVVAFPPGALEQRRLSRHWQRQSEEWARELQEVERRDDPASRDRAAKIRKDLHSRAYSIEDARRTFTVLLSLTIAGAVCLAAAIALALFRLLRRPKQTEWTEPDERPRPRRRRSADTSFTDEEP